MLILLKRFPTVYLLIIFEMIFQLWHKVFVFSLQVLVSLFLLLITLIEQYLNVASATGFIMVDSNSETHSFLNHTVSFHNLIRYKESSLKRLMSIFTQKIFHWQQCFSKDFIFLLIFLLPGFVDCYFVFIELSGSLMDLLKSTFMD